MGIIFHGRLMIVELNDWPRAPQESDEPKVLLVPRAIGEGAICNVRHQVRTLLSRR